MLNIKGVYNGTCVRKPNELLLYIVLTRVQYTKMVDTIVLYKLGRDRATRRPICSFADILRLSPRRTYFVQLK